MSSFLSRASSGVYAKGDTLKTGGVFPVFKDAAKTFRYTGVMMKLSDTYTGTTTKISDLYPECMRSGTLIKEVIADDKRKGFPMPIFRVRDAVTAEGTKLTVVQGYGLPVLKTGIKICPYGDKSNAITLGTVTASADGFSAEVTITANSLGVLAKGDYLVLEACADWFPEGINDEPREYYGLDLSTTEVDCNICDGARIDERVTAGIPLPLWRACLQTIKLW